MEASAAAAMVATGPNAMAAPLTNPMAATLTCSICLGLFMDPAGLPCQHKFCFACIDHYLRQAKQAAFPQ